MKIKNIFLLILLVLNISLSAQINKNGIPLIKNYAPSDYNSAEQNWAICEDNRGVIYVGNTLGILEYDGKNWSLIPLTNGSIVRSLAVSDDGIVYVGGVSEFGYLAPNKSGKMNYHSLSTQLDSIDFNDVLNIYTIGEDVYFCSVRSIYKFTDKKFNKRFREGQGSFKSFKLEETIYWGNYYEHGIMILKDDTVTGAKGGDFYLNKDIFSVLPWSDEELFIATSDQGIFIYNTETGLSRSLFSLGENHKKLYQILNQTRIYGGIKLSNGNYAISTLDNGCIIFDQDGEIIYQLNKENGLQDFTVINLFESSNGILWFGLNMGISYAEINTPFSKLDHAYGIEGLVLGLKRFNGVLYVGTTAGLYYLDYTSDQWPIFKKIPVDEDPSVWNIETVQMAEFKNKKLLIASDYGVWECFPDQSVKMISHTDNPYIARVIYQSKIHPNTIFIGNEVGLARIDFINNRWVDKGHQSGIKDEIRTIAEDDQGNIWMGTELNGVLKLCKDSSVVRYGLDNGLPDLNNNKVYFTDNNLVCATKKGVYYYNTNTDAFEKYNGFGEKYFTSTDQINIIYSNEKNEYWITSKDIETNFEYIEKLNISQDRIVTIEDIPFKRLFKNSFYDIEFDNDNGTWIATADAIYNYQENNSAGYERFYNNLIRKIEMGIDSVVFHGTYYKDTTNLLIDVKQPKELIKTVKYKNNSYNFFYSTPFVPTDELKYSFILEGYEDKWSNWEVKADKEYTNLDEGHYIFKVKAKNIYGTESETASYEFSIKPPWYKTILAYFFYFVAGIVVIIVIVKIYTRRLEQEKIRLEQIVKERTEEVVKQKDELEIQRDEIAEKNRSITDSIKYAERIQKAILPSDEFAKEVLPEHFILFRPRDIVSGDFYWMTKKDNLIVVIAADCTGHGVPGAFMSMLGVSFLNEIVNRHEVTLSSVILNNLRRDIKKTLGQEGKEGEAKDGMDIALCVIDIDNMKMQFSGAYNPLYLYRNNELLETKGDRMPIGIHIKEKDSFTNNEIDLQKGDVFYIFSDGFQDQFGGEDGQKFKTKNYKQLLLEIHQKPMAEQREILDTTVDKWRGKWEQVDDIIILGIRV